MERPADLGSAATFDRVIQADDHRPSRHERLDQQAQQDASGMVGRPACPVQNPVVVLEVRVVRQTEHPQGGGDRRSWPERAAPRRAAPALAASSDG